jgi:hypothetical protein
MDIPEVTPRQKGQRRQDFEDLFEHDRNPTALGNVDMKDSIFQSNQPGLQFETEGAEREMLLDQKLNASTR